MPILLAIASTMLLLQGAPAQRAQASRVASVEIVATEGQVVKGALEIRDGETRTLRATVRDSAGRSVAVPILWFGLPSDVVTVLPVDVAEGTWASSFFEPATGPEARARGNVVGEGTVSALAGGVPGVLRVRVLPAAVREVRIRRGVERMMVGEAVRLDAELRTAAGAVRHDVAPSWASDRPGVASVDPGGLVIARARGRARLTASAEEGSTSIAIEVIPSTVQTLAVASAILSEGPGGRGRRLGPAETVRAGDVVRLSVEAKDRQGRPVSVRPLWAVSAGGATAGAARVYDDGAFVARSPGTYVVVAALGEKVATRPITVTSRGLQGRLEIVGRVPITDVATAELWPHGDHLYVSTVSDHVRVYSIADPAAPAEVTRVKVDAHIMNDVMVSPDGRYAVASREGASNRRNGIVLIDTSDPAQAKILSHYTETVTGGVHSAFLYRDHVFATHDGDGALHIIDVSDLARPREVATWRVDRPGPYLHDVYVADGLAYLSYWRDGLVILDVGNGIKGGSLREPKLVSQFTYDHRALYGDDRIAGAHTAYRYKDYLFVGDEVFPPLFELGQYLDARGIVHVLDVSDIEHPKEVATYGVPEAGAHNFFVENDRLYIGHYQGGVRVVDVSGELRGDLYRQGRELARLIPVDAPERSFSPNLPFTWGAMPYRGLVWVNDVNTGIWILRFEEEQAVLGTEE